MSQAYSDPSREDDLYELPDVEVFYVDKSLTRDPETVFYQLEVGYYYWYCLPGCLPDSDPIGPFDTEENALAEAQADSE